MKYNIEEIAREALNKSLIKMDGYEVLKDS